MDFDFSDVPDQFVERTVKKKEKKDKSKYKINGRRIKYNSETMDTYISLRRQKMDPFCFIPMEESTAFVYPYQWDPYTGEKLLDSEGNQMLDPYGPLYFHPESLIRYFDIHKLDHLWINDSDESGGFFQGIYDCGVGAGEDFEVVGRGTHPEWYLFRLPIINCYLTDDHNEQVITMGPKLTLEELHEIDEKANRGQSTYRKYHHKKRPSLVQMKQFYDQAISKTPGIIIDDSDSSEDQLDEPSLKGRYYTANCLAVNQLSIM